MATKTYKTKDGATVRVTTNSDGSRSATVTNSGNSNVSRGTTVSRSATGEVSRSSSPTNYNLTNQNSRYTDWNMVNQGQSPDIAYTTTPNSSTGGALTGLTANKDWGIITDATGSYNTKGRGATLNSSVKGLSNTYNYSNSGINSNIYTPSQLVTNNKNISLGGYQFGTAAELAEKNSPGYLNARNKELAQLLSSNGVLDKEGIGQYLSQYDSFANYDISGQTNTINNIYNEIIRQQGQTQQQPQEINLNSPFMQTVDSILKSAYGIDSVDAIKDMYGAENYYNLMNALKDVEGTWNATDPASRAQLQGQLQEIIGSVVGTGVDQSKLNLNMEAVLSQFTPQARQQIEQDVLAVQNLQTKGYSVEQIAKQTGMSKDQVNQLVLLNQGLPSQIGKYYDLNNETEEFITEDYERARDNLMANYKWNMEQVNQQLDQIKQDFNKTYLDQQEANENTLHNMDLIAGMTGTGYSRRGLEGMSYAQQQANAVLNNLLDNYDRSNLEIANSIKSLTMAYNQSDAELVDQMNDAIMNAKNNYITQVSNIQAKYGLVGLEGQQAIAQAVQGFVNQAETIYNNAFNRAWTNTNNLISAVSSIGAIEQQQMQTKQMKIAEFQQDSMYMTQSQLKDYAQKNGLQMQYDQLVAYQQEATTNTLAQYGLPAYKYSDTVSKLLSQGYTPVQAVNQILNSAEAQADMGSTNETWNKLNDNTLYSNLGNFKSMNGTNSGYTGQDNSVKTKDYTYQTVDLQNGQQVSVGDQFEVAGDTRTITQIGGSKTGGVDFAPSVAGTHDPIPAFESGKVVRKGTDKDGNNYIEILNDNGYVYRYNHLESVPTLKVGDTVQAGQIIAKMGNTGNVKGATGVHLDLAVYDKSRASSTSVSPLDQATQTRVIFGGNTNGDNNGGYNAYEDIAKQWIDGQYTYSELKAIYGADELNKIGQYKQQLLQQGYTPSKVITDPEKLFAFETKLKKEFDNANEGNQASVTQINKMNQALAKIDKNQSGSKLYNNAASQTIIMAFNKLLDPNSVVRESEYARTPEGVSLIHRIEGKLEQIANGGAGLTYADLKAIVDMANEFGEGYKKNLIESAQMYKGYADMYGLTLENILPISIIKQLDATNKNSNFKYDWWNPFGSTTTTGNRTF